MNGPKIYFQLDSAEKNQKKKYTIDKLKKTGKVNVRARFKTG